MKKKAVPLIVGVFVVCMALLYFHTYTPKSFDEMIPDQAKPIRYCEVVLETQPVDEGVFVFSEEQIADMIELLDQFQYKKVGSASAIQNCVARLFLGSDNQHRVEMMLTSDLRVLMNYLDIKDKQVIYQMIPDTEMEHGEQLLISFFQTLKRET